MWRLLSCTTRNNSALGNKQVCMIFVGYHSVEIQICNCHLQQLPQINFSSKNHSSYALKYYSRRISTNLQREFDIIYPMLAKYIPHFISSYGNSIYTNTNKLQIVFPLCIGQLMWLKSRSAVGITCSRVWLEIQVSDRRLVIHAK